MSEVALAQGKPFYPTINALSAELETLFADGDFNGVLVRLQAFVQAVILDRRALAKVFADPVLDAWCQRIGAAVAAEVNANTDAAHAESRTDRVDCLIVATELYRAGGHSAVIEDLVHTGCFGPETVVMLTDALHTADIDIVAERFGNAVSAELSPAGSLLDKLRWTLRRIAALRPRRLVLFNHHHDPVAIAAAQPGSADETVFYHHADHQLCLGVTLKHTLHVDPHPMGFHNCREALSVDGNVYWPLVADDLGAFPHRTHRDEREGLRTCSCGSHNKFEHEYRYQYVDVLPEVLAATGATHTHIGPLSDATIAAIHARLDALGVERERFVHVPWVRSVWKALHEHQIDVYVASFPLGGGRVMIESMGSGVPVIAHDCYQSPFLGGKDMLYPSAFVWQHPEQLIAHLARARADELAAEGLAARLHYERYHTSNALLRHIVAGRNAPPAPARGPHHDDPMQTFLDDVRYALTDHLTRNENRPLVDLACRLEVELSRAGDVLAIEVERANALRIKQAAMLSSLYTKQIGEMMERYGAHIAQSEAALVRAEAREAEQRRRIDAIEASSSWRLASALQSFLARFGR